MQEKETSCLNCPCCQVLQECFTYDLLNIFQVRTFGHWMAQKKEGDSYRQNTFFFLSAKLTNGLRASHNGGIREMDFQFSVLRLFFLTLL